MPEEQHEQETCVSAACQWQSERAHQPLEHRFLESEGKSDGRKLVRDNILSRPRRTQCIIVTAGTQYIYTHN